MAQIDRPDRALQAQLDALASGCLDQKTADELRAFVYGWKLRIGK